MAVDLIAPTYESTEQWSYAFRRTVAALQGKSMDEVPRMFYTCFNTGTDEEAQSVLTFADGMRNQAARASPRSGRRLARRLRQRRMRRSGHAEEPR
jgi:hypothetical protein